MISRTYMDIVAGGSLGAAQAMGARLVDSKLAANYLQNPTTAFNPKLLKTNSKAAGFFTVGNLTNGVLSGLELYGGNHYLNIGKTEPGIILSAMGGAGAVGYVINGVMPSSEVVNAIASDPSNPVGIAQKPSLIVNKPVMKPVMKPVSSAAVAVPSGLSIPTF